MKRVALIAASLIAAAGCIRVESTLTIKEDGSGSLQATYSAPEQTLAQLRAAAKLTAELDRVGGAGEPPARKDYVDLFLFDTEEQIKREIASLKPYSVSLIKLKAENREGRRQVNIEIGFQSLAELAKTDIFRQYGFTLTRNRDGDYVLQRPPLNREKTDVPDFSKPDAVKELTPLLGGFHVEIRVNTPARILRTNAPSKETRTALWTFDFDNHPDSFLAFQNEGLGLVFEGRKLKLPEIGHVDTPPESAAPMPAEN